MDLRNRRDVSGEASPQQIKVGQPARVQIGLEKPGQLALAGPFMRQGQQFHGPAAGDPFPLPGEQVLEGAAIGRMGKQLVAVDQVSSAIGLCFSA